MKTFLESKEYTKKKKAHQTGRLEYSFVTESVDALEEYLITGNKIAGSTKNEIDSLGTWNHWNFINNYVAINELEYALLVKATYYHIECNNWAFFLGKWREHVDFATSFTKSIKHLGQLLYLRQTERAIQYGKLLLKMLYGKQYKGWHVFPKHPWFMMELFCKWQNIELDYDKLNYPDSLGVYENTLQHWDTTDTELLSALIDKLSDFHIKQSSEYEQETEKDENGDGYDLEFTSADYFIFPIEILIWLAIRREMGLPEYEPSPKNELMQLEINRLPEKVVPWPTDELVEKCKAKLKADNPEIDFELDF